MAPLTALERRRPAGVLLGAGWLHVGDPAAIVEAEVRLAGP